MHQWILEFQCFKDRIRIKILMKFKSEDPDQNQRMTDPDQWH